MSTGKKQGDFWHINFKSASQIISQIEETTGEITTDPLKINDAFKKYYFDLYSSESLKDSSLF